MSSANYCNASPQRFIAYFGKANATASKQSKILLLADSTGPLYKNLNIRFNKPGTDGRMKVFNSE
jgi:hypothetical protein